jgi:hypothetical protein
VVQSATEPPPLAKPEYSSPLMMPKHWPQPWMPAPYQTGLPHNVGIKCEHSIGAILHLHGQCITVYAQMKTGRHGLSTDHHHSKSKSATVSVID